MFIESTFPEVCKEFHINNGKAKPHGDKYYDYHYGNHQVVTHDMLDHCLDTKYGIEGSVISELLAIGASVYRYSVLSKSFKNCISYLKENYLKQLRHLHEKVINQEDTTGITVSNVVNVEHPFVDYLINYTDGYYKLTMSEFTHKDEFKKAILLGFQFMSDIFPKKEDLLHMSSVLDTAFSQMIEQFESEVVEVKLLYPNNEIMLCVKRTS